LITGDLNLPDGMGGISYTVKTKKRNVYQVSANIVIENKLI